MNDNIDNYADDDSVRPLANTIFRLRMHTQNVFSVWQTLADFERYL